MTINPSDLQAVVDRLEKGEDLSERDSQLLVTAAQSRQITLATGEGAVAIGGSADGATILTVNGNIFINGANAESILNLLRERGLPDAPRVAHFPRVRLPDNFVPRPDAFNAVKAKLLGEDDSSAVLSERTLVVSAIAGLGGIGKSVLATALVLDREVQARFEDGILWVTLGQNPDLLSLLGDWIRELDKKSREAFSANTLEAAAGYLGTLLAERRMLLVVDDVWNAAHAEWFRVGGGGCRILVTTREARLDGAEYYELDLMTEAEAIELVRKKLGQRWQSAQEAEVRAFANLLGRLPLALDLAATQVRNGLTWGELRSEFEAERRAVFLGTGRRSSALQLLDSSEAWERLGEEEQRKYSLQACFNLSLKRLNPQQLEQFAWLGVLPEDVNLDRRVAAVLWDLSPLRAQKVLIDLRNRSFLTGGVDTIEGEQSYRVHDLMHDMARISIDCPPSNESNQLCGLGMSLPAAHQGFLERYRSQAQDRRWDKLPSNGYIHRHLTWHMKQAGWLDEIHALMAMSDDRGNNAWFEACDRIGQPAIFVEDVARAWELAEQMYESEPMRSIVLQCRYALITVKLNTLVANLPIGMMAEFVQQGFWAVEQAWAYVEQIQNESDIESAIQVLAPYLTKTLFSLGVEKARSMRDEYYRFWSLLGLAEIDSIYFSEAVDAARLIKDESNRANILTFLAKIDSVYLPEAVDAARSLDDKSSQAHVLGSLSKIDSVYLSETVDVARSIEDISSQAKTLTFLAKIDSVYLPEAVDMARSINDESSRASVLGSLSEIDSVYLSEAIAAALLIKDHSQSQSLILSSLAEINGANFLEFLAVARLIEEESYRASILSSLAKMDGADLAELFAETHSIKDKSSRVDVLISLAEIDSAYFSEALNVARSMQKDSSRAHALIGLAKIDSAYSSEAITAVRLVDDWMDRNRILNDLAEIGADYSQLLAVFRSIQDDSHRAYILIDLAKIDISYFSDALAIARSIQSESSRAHILVSLAKIDSTYCSEAFVSARLVRDEFERVKILIRLVEINGDYFSEALAAALSIEYEFRQADFLKSLAKIDGADLSALLAAARSMEYAFDRATVSIGLAEIDRSYLPEALAEARSIQNESSRAHLLVSLAKIDSTYCSEVLALTHSIQDEFNYLSILRDITEINGANFSELLIVVNSIKKESSRAHLLGCLAKISKGADFFELLALANSIQDESKRAKVLSSIAKIAGADLSALLTAARSIENESNRVEILISLAEIDSIYFAEAFDIVGLLPHEFSQAMHLGDLAAIAPQSFLLKFLEAISQIAHKPTRAEALRRCLPHFSLDRLSHQEWCKYLHILAHSQRSHLIHALPQLYPAILHLGGATAMRGVADAMNEICSQWR